MKDYLIILLISIVPLSVGFGVVEFQIYSEESKKTEVSTEYQKSTYMFEYYTFVVDDKKYHLQNNTGISVEWFEKDNAGNLVHALTNYYRVCDYHFSDCNSSPEDNPRGWYTDTTKPIVTIVDNQSIIYFKVIQNTNNFSVSKSQLVQMQEGVKYDKINDLYSYNATNLRDAFHLEGEVIPSMMSVYIPVEKSSDNGVIQ